MANEYIPCPDARFRAWQNNFVTYVNGHVADLRSVAGVGWGRDPRPCVSLFREIQAETE